MPSPGGAAHVPAASKPTHRHHASPATSAGDGCVMRTPKTRLEVAVHPSAGAAPSGAPADQATVRRMNLALLMRSLVSGGPRSRARLAENTGLNKATVSSLVAELMDRRLVTEGPIDRSGVGRPGRVVQVDSATVRFMGLEVNVDHIIGVLTDLTGRTVARRRIAASMRDLGPARGIGRLADLARELLTEAAAEPDDVQSIHVSVPGLVDIGGGILTFAPNLHWRQVDVVHSLRGRLGWPRTRIQVDNDANLGAMAEYSVGPSAGSSPLLFLVGEVGVGAGMIIDGRIIRGRMGYAGEVGHLPLGNQEHRCDCGRFGCWETAVGLRALFGADGEGPDADGDTPTRLAGLIGRAAAGDQRTVAILTDVGRWLGIGVSVLANLIDPEVIVLGGHFAVLRSYLEPAVRMEMRARIVSEPQLVRLEFSRFGFDAPVVGAAHAGIDMVVGDPTLVPLH